MAKNEGVLALICGFEAEQNKTAKLIIKVTV